MPYVGKSLFVKGLHQHGCLMALLPDALTSACLALSRSIPDAQLGSGGKEKHPHITVKFGLPPEVDLRELKALLIRHGPVSIKLGGLSLFEGNEDGDGDVLKVDIKSPSLHELNSLVSKSFPCVDTHPEYHPHITIAYLKPEFSQAWADTEFPLEGSEHVLEVCEYSSASGVKELIPLTGEGCFPCEVGTPGEKKFTGRKEDRLGRTQCYQEGEHVSCATGSSTPRNPDAFEGDKPPLDSEEVARDYQENGTRAKAFKSWFGDWDADPANASKVVDKDTGEPQQEHGTAKMVHHGTRGKFNQFEKEKAGTGGGLAVGRGFYFAENRDIAEAYAGEGSKKPGKVITAYLNIRKPFDFDKEYAQQDVDRLLALAKELDPRFDEKWFLSERGAEGSSLKGSDVWEDLKSSVGTVDPNDILEKSGFDGLTHLAAGLSGAPPLRGGRKPTWGRVWVAFQPNQVKSVDNRGTFDPNEQDFTKSLDQLCPLCGSKATSFEGGWRCGSPPCEWSVFASDMDKAVGNGKGLVEPLSPYQTEPYRTTPYQNQPDPTQPNPTGPYGGQDHSIKTETEGKALSTFSEGSGGALVQPPLQPKKDTPGHGQYLFVYGTLRSGHRYHGFLAGEDFVGPASTLPGYSLQEHGSFPALGEGHGSVRGELYKVGPRKLEELKEWEDHYQLKPVKVRGLDKPALAFFWRKHFAGGETVHAKETLYAPAGVGTVKEVFAKKRDRLRVVKVWANGAVEVERSDGKVSTFFPGQFEEFRSGKGLDHQVKGKGKPCGVGEDASRTGCIPASGEPSPAPEQPQSQRTGGKQAVLQIVQALHPSAILQAVRTAARKVRNPRQALREARRKAAGRFRKLQARYGTVGACAIAGAYAGYYVVAAGNPGIMLLVPSPSAVLLGSAECLRYGWRKLTGKKGLETDDLVAAVKEFLAELAGECGEEVPEVDWDVMKAVAQRLQSSSPGDMPPQVPPSPFQKHLGTYQAKGAGQPCKVGESASNVGCIPRSGGAPSGNGQPSQGAGGSQPAPQPDVTGGQGAAQPNPVNEQELEQQAREAVQAILQALGQIPVSQPVRDATARAKDELLDKLKRQGDKAKVILCAAVLSTPVPAPNSQPATVALALLVSEAFQAIVGAEEAAPAPQPIKSLFYLGFEGFKALPTQAPTVKPSTAPTVAQTPKTSQSHPPGQPFKGPSGRWFVVRPEDNRTVPWAAPDQAGGETALQGQQEAVSGQKQKQDEDKNFRDAEAAIEKIKGGHAASQFEKVHLAASLFNLSMDELMELKDKHGLKAEDDVKEILIRKINEHLHKLSQKEEHGGEPERGPGSGSDAGGIEESGGGMEGEAERPIATKAGGGRKGADKPTRVKALKNESIDRVNNRIDRYIRVFRAKGEKDAAEWMEMLKDHLNTIGPEQALAALGEARLENLPITQKVQYEGADEDIAEAGYISIGEVVPEEELKFVRGYLNRAGIVLIGSSSTVDPDSPYVSSFSARNLEALERTDRPSGPESYVPTDQTFENKLIEAQHLPGLESTEDLDKVVGSKVTAFTPDVVAMLDAKYGEGKWIVKTYGDEGFASFGIFFPQRVSQIQMDARAVIKDTSSELKSLGYGLVRDEDGKIIGLSKGKRSYAFGSAEYNKLSKSVRALGRQISLASRSERGAVLPLSTEQDLSEGYYGISLRRDAEGVPIGITDWDGEDYDFDAPEYKEVEEREGGAAGHAIFRALESDRLKREGKDVSVHFMVQPAFPAVGVTEKDRALGSTWETAKEGRVHVTTRGGKAAAIPYATLVGRGDALPAVFPTEDSKAMEKAVEDAINQLPESERTGQVYAPDVLKTADGWKVIELNPSAIGGGSAWLGSDPFVIDAMVSQIAGRDPMHVQFIRKLLKDSGVGMPDASLEGTAQPGQSPVRSTHRGPKKIGRQTKPPQENQYNPDPLLPNSSTGIPDHARVGVPAMLVPPPPPIGRLPNLDDDQRAVESRFAEAFAEDPDKMAHKYLKALRKRKVGEYPNVFATDDVKALNGDWNPSGIGVGEKLDQDTKRAMARYNAAIHQTANAVAKRAFLSHLDEVVSKLPEGERSVLVTNGGCAAGKGSTVRRAADPNDPHHGMISAAEQVGAIWDAAGEQNATENAWVYQECKKRGIKPVFAYVWADPNDTWDHPERGVIRRAIRKGRMVDARLFADSYALGAKNMKAFVDSKPEGAEFIFIDNRDKANPKLLDSFPEETLSWDADTIYRNAVTALMKRKDDLDPALFEGGMIGSKIWGPPKGGSDDT